MASLDPLTKLALINDLKALLELPPRPTNASIAKRIGVTETTVERYRRLLTTGKKKFR